MIVKLSLHVASSCLLPTKCVLAMPWESSYPTLLVLPQPWPAFSGATKKVSICCHRVGGLAHHYAKSTSFANSPLLMLTTSTSPQGIVDAMKVCHEHATRTEVNSLRLKKWTVAVDTSGKAAEKSKINGQWRWEWSLSVADTLEDLSKKLRSAEDGVQENAPNLPERLKALSTELGRKTRQNNFLWRIWRKGVG